MRPFLSELEDFAVNFPGVDLLLPHGESPSLLAMERWGNLFLAIIIFNDERSLHAHGRRIKFLKIFD